MAKGMFTELMEAVEPDQPTATTNLQTPRRPHIKPRQDDLLPTELEDLSEAGYNSHSYRFTDAEIRWLRRACLRLSEMLDRPIAHNTLIRVLLRLADSEWRANPNDNRLIELLSKLKT